MMYSFLHIFSASGGFTPEPSRSLPLDPAEDSHP